MATAKKNSKNAVKSTPEEVAAALQALIAQGKKEGMIRSQDLHAQLEKMDLTPEKIEEIYDRFEAMNIQVVSGDLDLDLGDDEILTDYASAADFGFRYTGSGYAGSMLAMDKDISKRLLSPVKL